MTSAGDDMTDRGKLTPVLTRRWLSPTSWTIDTYLQFEGYSALRTALSAHPDQLIQLIKDSGLRGRGGAGFPTGMKWGFIPQGDEGAAAKPHYLVINADESEPGTCKDIPLMMADPHSLIEGSIITSYAIRAKQCFIYVRGEVLHPLRRVQNAVNEAYAAGYLGKDILGSGFDLDMVVHAGAGAYICGEETALLDSLEGRRGQPRLRPPFPATHGLFGCPSTVNNVESISAVPFILRHGVDWFTQWGTEKSPGNKLIGVSGEVANPGNFDVALNTPISGLLEMAGGMQEGKELKFFFPGGSSTPILPAADADTPYTYEAIAEKGSMLGSGAVIFHSNTTCVVDVVLRYTEFYEHESCGKCTPCREGGYWLSQVLRRIETGTGRTADLELLVDVCDNIFGRSFCALGDALTTPIMSSLKHFRAENEEHVRQGRCPLGTTPPRRDILVLEPSHRPADGHVVPPATTDVASTDAPVVAGQA